MQWSAILKNLISCFAESPVGSEYYADKKKREEWKSQLVMLKMNYMHINE